MLLSRSRAHSGPMRELERGAELPTEGVFDHRVDVQSGDEIGGPARACGEAVEGLSEARPQEQFTLVGRMAASMVRDIGDSLNAIMGSADAPATTDGAAARADRPAMPPPWTEGRLGER